LPLAQRERVLALIKLAIDSDLHGRDLDGLRLCELTRRSRVLPQAMVMQQKTWPVRFEITGRTGHAVAHGSRRGALVSGIVRTPTFSMEHELKLFSNACRSAKKSPIEIYSLLN